MRYTHRKLITGKVLAFIDVSPELNMEDFGGEDVLTFQISTYGNINKSKINEAAWNNVCYPPNKFFETFDVDDCRKFISAVVDVKLNIMTFFGEVDNGVTDLSQLPKFTKKLSNMLLKLDEEINLCKRIRQFVDDEDIQTGLAEKVELRPQDTKGLTITQLEAKDIISIIILCKILFPIMGEIIGRLKPNNLGKHQDPHCKAITIGMVSKHWKKLHIKIDDYITYFVAKETNQARLHHIYNGMNELSLSIFIMSSLFVRNFINYNLFDTKERSVPGYVHSIINHVVGTQSSQSYNNRVAERKPLVSSDEDPNNVADLEVHSVSTKAQFDTLAIIEACIPDVSNKAMLMYEIDTEEVDSACAYHLKNPIEPNILTTSLLAGFYKSWMSGKNIKYLNNISYTRLAIILQFILIEQNKFELATMLTSLTTGVIKPIEGIPMQQLRAHNQNYNLIEQEFSTKQGATAEKMWRDHVTKIIETLTTREFLMNMYYKLYDTMKMENLNGRKISIKKDIMFQFYEFISEML